MNFKRFSITALQVVGLGYAFKLAKQPMQISLEAYYNVVRPTVAGEELLGDWTIRTQWQVLFPK